MASVLATKALFLPSISAAISIFSFHPFPRFPLLNPTKRGASVESCAGHSVFGMASVLAIEAPFFPSISAAISIFSFHLFPRFPFRQLPPQAGRHQQQACERSSAHSPAAH